MSSYEDMRAMMIKKCRCDLLSALNAMYGLGPFDFVSLCSALTHLELPDDSCVKQDLKYLIDKGYVRWTNEKPMQPWKERLYELTARGKEIVDKIAKDPALEP
jgi:hypothetical protein